MLKRFWRLLLGGLFCFIIAASGQAAADSPELAYKSKFTKHSRHKTIRHYFETDRDYERHETLYEHIRACQGLLAKDWQLEESDCYYLFIRNKNAPGLYTVLRYRNSDEVLVFATLPVTRSSATWNKALEMHIQAAHIFGQSGWQTDIYQAVDRKIVLDVEEMIAHSSGDKYFKMISHWYQGDDRDIFQKDKYRGEGYGKYFRAVLDKALTDFY